MEYNIETSTDQFTDYILEPYLCEYKVVIFSETEDGNIFTLLDQSGKCPHGIVDGPIKELCIKNIEDLVDLKLSTDQIKFWYLDDSNDIITVYYAVCIQNNIDDRWIHINELKEIPIIAEDRDLIKKLYKYIAKKDIE